MTTVLLGELATLSSGGTPSRNRPEFYMGSIPWITGADIDLRGRSKARSFITDDAVAGSAASVVPAGTIVLVTRTSVGKVGVVNEPTAFSQDITAIRHDERRVDLSYLVHFLRTKEKYFISRARGATIQGVTREAVSNLPVPLRSLAEQRRIAAILDQADDLNAKRRRVLTQLDDLAQSIFLDMFDDDQMSRLPIGDFADVRTGSTPSRDDAGHYGGSIPWVKTGEVHGTITATSECVTERGMASARLRLFPVGSVVVAMYGQGKTRGQSAILGIEATTNQACAVILPNERFDPVFLQAQLAMSYDRLRGSAEGGNQPNLSIGRVQKFDVDLPPIARQRLFATRIEQLATQRALVERALVLTGGLIETLRSTAFSGEL